MKDDASNLRLSPIHRSALRPVTFLGVERTPGILSILAGLVLAYSALLAKSLWILVIAIVVFMALLAAFKALAKIDPLMSQVYIRHVRYRRFYGSRSKPFRDL